MGRKHASRIVARMLHPRWISVLVGIQFVMVVWWVYTGAEWLGSKEKENVQRQWRFPLHEALSKNLTMGTRAVDSAMPTIRIEVIANNRLAPLKRLLYSLKQADYMGASVPMDIHLEANESDSLLAMVVSFDWPFGQKQVHLRHSKGGLINAVLESWYPASMEEMAILLEDDIEVSPFFYQWVTNCANMLRNTAEFGPHVVGVSLYTPRVGELKTERPYMNFTDQMLKVGEGEAKAFHFQLPCSWGALYFPHFWRELRAYASLREDPRFTSERFVIPGSRSTGWSSSWKKYAIELFWSKGYFLMYPNFPNQSSFATNHLEPGEHIAKSRVKHLPKDYTVPLLSGNASVFGAIREIWERDVAMLPTFDLFGLPIQKWRNWNRKLVEPPVQTTETLAKRCTDKLRRRPCETFSARLNSFMKERNKLTLVISHFWTEERAFKLKELLQYYATSTVVHKIFVVWHSTVVPCPANVLLGAIMVIFSCQACDSLNNRFLLDMRITTDAVLIMDDDIQVHLDDLERLFLAWQENRDRVVGFFPRWFQPVTNISGRYVQKQHMLTHSQGYSFILTKAMIVDFSYIHEYRCGLGRHLHDIVDVYMNGEDIAFNVMIGKLKNKVPALFVKPEWPIVDYGTYSGGGLHTRSKSHDSVRSELLSYFMSLLNVTSRNLCCENEIVTVGRGRSNFRVFRWTFTELQPYVYNPCKDRNSTSLCHYTPYSRLNKTKDANFLLQL